MKKYLIRCVQAFLLGLLVSAFTGQPPNQHFSLAWDYPTNSVSDDLQFNMYCAVDASLPLTDWTIYSSGSYTQYWTGTVSGTNYTYALSNNVPAMRSLVFFVTASNMWGESMPSNTVTSSPSLKPISNTLRIVPTP